MTLLFPAAVGSLWWLRDTYFDLRREPQHVLHTVKLKALNVDCSQLGENWSDRTTAVGLQQIFQLYPVAFVRHFRAGRADSGRILGQPLPGVSLATAHGREEAGEPEERPVQL